MIYILQNLMPILAAAAASLVFGALWHRGFGMTRAQISPVVVLVALAAEAWMAAILAGALILAPVEAGVWTVALGTAVILWAGFVLPVLAGTYAVQRRWRLIPIDAGHWLGVLLIQAAVMRAIGVEAPIA